MRTRSKPEHGIIVKGLSWSIPHTEYTTLPPRYNFYDELASTNLMDIELNYLLLYSKIKRYSPDRRPMINRFLPSGNSHPLLNITNSKAQLFFVFLLGILFAIAALATVVYGTSFDPWVHSDSVAYLMTAHNFANGRGFGLQNPPGKFSPLTLHAPMYSLILSLAGDKLDNTLILARYLNLFSFAILNLILFYGLYRNGKNIGLAVSISLLALCSPMPLYLFTGAMSEPLFILFIISSLFVLSWALRVHSFKGEVLVAILIGNAILIRYAGYGFLAAAVMSLLLLSQGSIWRRLGRSAIFTAIAVIPQILWSQYIQFMYQPSQQRSFFIQVENLWGATQPFRIALVDSLWEFMPFSDHIFVGQYPQKRLILLFLGAGLILLVVTTWLNTHFLKSSLEKSGSSLRLLATVSGFYAFSYLAFLAFAFLFADPHPDINTRMLAPVLIPIWICWGCVLVVLGRLIHPLRFLTYLPLLIAGISLMSSIPQSRDILVQLHQSGEGYTGYFWKNSGVIQLIDELSSDTILISNDSAAILFLTGRPAYDIPELIHRTPLTAFSRFGDDLDDPVQKVFRSQNAVLVLFDTFRWQLDTIYYEDALARMQAFTDGLNLIQDTHDGALYTYKKSTTTP